MEKATWFSWLVLLSVFIPFVANATLLITERWSVFTRTDDLLKPNCVLSTRPGNVDRSVSFSVDFVRILISYSRVVNDGGDGE